LEQGWNCFCYITVPQTNARRAMSHKVY